jgi:hypothetical protein
MDWEACYSTPLEAEAHVVRGFLEYRGVPCVLEDERFGAQPLTFCALGQIHVLVPAAWGEVARRMIQRRTAVRRRRVVEGPWRRARDNG